jgi:hypothetical protein
MMKKKLTKEDSHGVEHRFQNNYNTELPNERYHHQTASLVLDLAPHIVISCPRRAK